MKKSIVVLIGCVLFLSCCTDTVEQVSGTYAYKISGSATVNGSSRVLGNEQGAMEIIRLTADSAIVTFNELGGAAYHTEAVIRNTAIELLPYSRDISIGAITYPIRATGKGNIYGRTILITLSYQSDEVSANEVELLCKKN